MRTVVVLCGPPGAGKSMAARASGLRVFDRDDPEWRGEADFRRGIAALATDAAARAVVIRAGASSSARAKACALVGATHCFLMIEPPEVLKERVASRRRGDFVTGLASIPTWFRSFDREDGVRDFPGWDLIDEMPLSVGRGSREW